QHDHVFTVKVVSLADESAGKRRGVGVDFAKVGLNTAEIDGRDFTGFRADNVRLLPPVDVGSDIANRGTGVFDRLSVFQREGFAEALFERALLIVRALIPARDEGGVGAELLDVLLNLLIEAGDERSDEHDDADTENDAEH